jgi:GTP1/Obg family GTP-binding protein
MADNEKDLSRVEARLDSLGLKVDDLLRILGKVEPLLEDMPKLRDKLQTLEVAQATLRADLTAVQTELKEARFKAMLATVGTSAVVGTGVAAAAHFM